MLGDFGTDKLRSNRFQSGECSCLVHTHEAAVSDDVGSKDGGQTAFNMRLKTSYPWVSISMPRRV
jgi:hypothetical protein